MKNLFETPEQRQAGIIAFTGLLNDEGWKLYSQILQANIDVLIDQILVGGIPEEKLNALRKKLEAYKEALNIPQDEIKRLQPIESNEPSLDPFETREELVERRKIVDNAN